jgi:phosphatidylglycerol lysyltransferase
MKNSMTSFIKGIRERLAILFKGNVKVVFRFLLTGLFIGLAVWFFNHEKTDLHRVSTVLFSANPGWIIAGLGLVVFYIFIQGLMYVSSFAAVNARLGIWDAVILFLKRNFISVFLPAGGISSLAFFSSSVEKRGISKTQVYFASSIYAFVGILSVIIVAIPAFLFAVSGSRMGMGKWYALGAAILILALIYFVYKSLIKKKLLYSLLIQIWPDAEVFIDDLGNQKINPRQFLNTVLISVIIEFVGIAHVFISMKALNLSPSISSAILAYIIVVLFLIVSPFLRGLGAIEVSMTFVLHRTGYTNIDAMAITLLFRLFEFWLPLFTGMLSFLVKLEKLLMRILPSLLIFSLGIVNIISVLTPTVPEKLQILRDYLFFDVVNFSNSFVLLTGLFMLVAATFMLKGLRTAWWFATVLSIFSVIGHITRGINLPEAGIALFVVLSLLITRREYNIRANPRLRTIGIQTALLSIAAVLIYGTVGFYYLDKKHFQIDFNIFQSFFYTFQNYFLVGSHDLVPADSFARDFLYTIKISGFASIAFLIYSLIRPYVFKSAPSPDDLEKATTLVKLYGRSSLDFFKTYSDKQIFFAPDTDAFVSFKVSGSFAFVLEDPIGPDREEMKKCIKAFGKYCYENSLKDIYYRVSKNSLEMYSNLSKKSLFLGQEGVVDLSAFTLEGGERKSIRNAINKIIDQGYSLHINTSPLKDGLIQKLRSVSDEWLKVTGKEEIVFSQGMFVEKEIKLQTVISVENKEEKIIAFLNIIPDYVKNEGTYDLLRKTSDAPNGVMDYLLIELFKYFKSNGIQFVNLGFAPMSGMDDPHNFTEKSMKYAYEKIRSFSHFKGQREYKEKFQPIWSDKYLVFDNDYDLLQIPAVLARIIKT